MIDITPIVTAVIALIGVIITTALIPYIRSRTTAEQRATLASWVQIAVTAAEQLYKGYGRGAEKKEYVLAFLAGKGLLVDSAQVEALIEAAVYELPKIISE